MVMRIPFGDRMRRFAALPGSKKRPVTSTALPVAVIIGLMMIFTAALSAQVGKAAAGKTEDKTAYYTDQIRQRVGREVDEAKLQRYVQRKQELHAKSQSKLDNRRQAAKDRYSRAQDAQSLGKVTASAAAVNVADSLALVALYNATNGASWTISTNWLTGPVDTWYGVAVVGDRVVAVDLWGNNLTGTLPADISALTMLELLDLSNNSIGGTLPDALGSLTALLYLDLGYNDFNGSIPSILGTLPLLEELFLDHNDLSGSIPSQLANIATLIALILENNELTGSIPPELSGLGLLEALDLDDNNLDGEIPWQLGNLANLTFLDLDGNLLTGSIPWQLVNLSDLEYLDLAGNLLTGSIPTQLGFLGNLVYMDLSFNFLEGSIPTTFNGLASLEELYLRANELTGSIPAELGQLPFLVFLDLSVNHLSGNIPSQLENLNWLFVLDLCFNELQGQIPAALGNISTLLYLGLWDNQLEGSIPDDLGKLLALIELDVATNRLTGTIPSNLNACTLMEWCYFEENQLSDMDNLSVLIAHLDEIYVYDNRLTFEDLEYNLPSLALDYSPQADVPIYGPAAVGGMLRINVTVGGTVNVYQWYHNGVAIPGANNDYYDIDPDDPWGFGPYYCEINNNIAAELTLYSETLVVRQGEIAAAPDPEDFDRLLPGQTRTRVMTIYNIGHQNLTVTGFRMTGCDSTEFVPDGSYLPFLIPMGGFKEFNIAYTPQSAGVHKSHIELQSSCPNRPALRVKVTGRCEVEESTVPSLNMAYPVAQSVAAPVNASLYWWVADDASAIDPFTISIQVNDSLIFDSGFDQTGGSAAIVQRGSGFGIAFTPGEPFDDSTEVSVRFWATDVAITPNTLDTTYSYFCGIESIALTNIDTIDVAACVITDDVTQISMSFPDSSVFWPTEIRVSISDGAPVLPDSVLGLAPVMHVWPHGLVLQKPALVTVPVTQAMLDSAGVTRPQDLLFYGYAPLTGMWSYLPLVSYSNSEISFEMTDFGYVLQVRGDVPPTAVDSDLPSAPRSFALDQNYPNPFNPSTHISFTLAEPNFVTLKIFDARGRMVKQLKSQQMGAGSYQAVWDGNDEQGISVSSGIYFIELRNDSEVLRRKCLLVK